MNQQPGSRQGVANQPRPAVSDDQLRQIIVEGDAKVLVECAKALGQGLKDANLKASQIRRIFGAMREIEMDWPLVAEAEQRNERAGEAKRQFLLLEPKIAYQEGRNHEVRPLGEVLKRAIRMVEGDRKRFQHFVEFFEATLAYHRAAGGSNS